MNPDLELQKNLAKWDAEPWTFAYQALGVKEIDPGQMKVLRYWNDPKVPRVAALAASGTGKTFIESVCVMHFLCCKGGKHPEDHPKGLATAIDGKNMEMNLWPELAKRIKGNELMDLLFKWQAEKIFCKRYPETWFFEKRTWDAKTVSGPNPSGALGLAGHHSKNSLFLIDESSGVPKSVLQAAERTLATHKGDGFVKIFQGGNPTHTSGPLWDAAHKERELWNGGDGPVIMTGDPDDPNRSPRIPIEWARQQIKIYGRDDPFVQVYILGQFPTTSFNNFLGPEEVEAAQQRDYPLTAYCESSMRAGMDVAYDGDDRSFFFPKQGNKAFEPTQIIVPLSSTTIGYDMANIVHSKIKMLDIEDVMLDATGGYANAVMEAMRMLGLKPIPIKFNEKPSSDAFNNIRTEMHWLAARWVKMGGALPNVPGLVEEACATRYAINPKTHKMQCEDKALVKKRLGRSPDLWESFILNFAIPEKPRGRTFQGESSSQLKSCLDVNPLNEYITRKPKVIDLFGGRQPWR